MKRWQIHKKEQKKFPAGLAFQPGRCRRESDFRIILFRTASADDMILSPIYEQVVNEPLKGIEL